MGRRFVLSVFLLPEIQIGHTRHCATLGVERTTHCVLLPPAHLAPYGMERARTSGNRFMENQQNLGIIGGCLYASLIK